MKVHLCYKKCAENISLAFIVKSLAFTSTYMVISLNTYYKPETRTLKILVVTLIYIITSEMNDHFQKQSTTHAVQQDSHIKTLEYNNNEELIEKHSLLMM